MVSAAEEPSFAILLVGSGAHKNFDSFLCVVRMSNCAPETVSLVNMWYNSPFSLAAMAFVYRTTKL